VKGINGAAGETAVKKQRLPTQKKNGGTLKGFLKGKKTGGGDRLLVKRLGSHAILQLGLVKRHPPPGGEKVRLATQPRNQEKRSHNDR